MLFSHTSFGHVRAAKVAVAVFLATLISSSSLVIAQSSDGAIAADAGMVVTKLWDDLNRDGIQDINEPGVSGVMVSLFNCEGTFVESRLSNDLGVTPFVAAQGCYQLRYSSIEGYRYCPSGLSGEVANDSDVNPSTRTSEPFTITAGTYQINVDAGVMRVQSSEIGDRVWHDLNANGVQDFNEPGFADVPVALNDCAGNPVLDLNGVPRSVRSDAHGNFLFDNLSSGCYTLETPLADGLYATEARSTSSQFDSDLDPASLQSEPIELFSTQGQHDLDIGVYRHGSIGDYVWLDVNRNGVQESTEQGMEGVSVLLLDQYGAPTGRTAVTDGSGHYEFADLTPGLYRLQFVIPENFVAAQKDQGDSEVLDNDGNSLGVTAPFSVVSDQTQSDIDFGVVQQQVVEIALEARTLGEDADSPIGPYISVGDNVSWEYIVTNTGDVPLFAISVQDDQGVEVSCPATELEAGDSLTCTATANDAQAGQYTNLAMVQATDNPETDSLVTAQDRSHYFGTDPAIALTILVNNVDADQPTDLVVQAGDTVVWQYVVTNTGNVPLQNVMVVDSNPEVNVNCPFASLESGVEMTCTAAAVAVAGEYSNTGTASGEVPEEDPVIVTATDTSFYLGSPSDLELTLLTNNIVANAPPGPMIPVGDTVTWTYRLTNAGQNIITNPQVTDSEGAVVSCPVSALAPGQSIDCTATGTAIEGQFSNSAFWEGAIDGEPSPPSNTAQGYYFGATPMAGVTFEVRTNGSDADTQELAPQIDVGAIVTWTYNIENSGNVALTNIVVTDDQLGTITCPQTTVEPGESLLCSASGVATLGAYTNLGSLMAETPDGMPVMASDPSNYFGVLAELSIEALTNDEDSDTPPGATIPVGEPVEWRYVVTNTGNIDLFGFTVADSVLGNISCPAIDILAGETIECVATGTAQAGQYANLATVCAPQNEEIICAEDPSHYFGGASGISIETRTNGADADSQSLAPQISVGETVTWTYNVTNTGTLTLTDVVVTDDQIGSITCPVNQIEPGETIVCTAFGTAELGAYTNLGSVSATDSQGAALQDSDPSNYFGVLFAIDIETLTNGQDADTPPGPTIAIGDPVEWTYVVTNTGNVGLFGFDVSDSVIGTVSCPVTDLEPGESVTCTASGTATAGQYMNIGTVCVPQNEEILCADDPSHYLGGVSSIAIETRTNGADADTPDLAPEINVGETVTWTYNVTNTGNTLLTDIVVTDDIIGVITCPTTEIQPGETIVCTATGTVQPGPYANVGSVVGTDPQGDTLDATDPTHHFGVQAGISIETLTNTIDADTPPGPTIPVGGDVQWTYIVTNTGNVDLFGFEVTDNILGPITCPVSDIAVGESIECFATGTATAGQYANVGSVCAPQGEELLCDDDPSHYFGGQGGLSIEKFTNGQDVDAAPGVALTVGEAVTWTYVVTNTGDLTITDLNVSDDQGVTVSCKVAVLEPGETTTCFGTGVATAGQYVNVGTACGQAGGTEVCDSDSSFYFGATPSVQLEKRTNDIDADTAPGPVIAAGETVSWTYIVTNTSDVALGSISVTDDQGVVVTCPMDTLAAGESMTCTGSGIATSGQYMNLGAVTALGLDAAGNPVGDAVTASDPSHYFGGTSGVSIEKFTNGIDVTAAPGPSIAAGDVVEWTYVVTNLGNVTLDDVVVVDDQGVAVSCPLTSLSPGQTMTCTGTGTAVAGQYTNLGSVTAQGVDGNGDPIGGPQTDSDPSFYFGVSGGLTLEKFTNGLDVTAAPGPALAVGDAVEWTYVVTNTGNVTLINVTVTDDQGVAVTCPMDTLAAGESMTCTGAGTVTAGQYMNIGSVIGQGVDGDGNPVGPAQSDSDPSFYFGADAGVDLEKFTNGLDVTAAPGPSVAVGDPVEWTYIVTNTGNVVLSNVSVSDDQGVVVSCPMTTLAVGESMTCTGSGTATAGQYMNLGSVTAQGVDADGNPVGAPQSDDDPSYYFGASGGIDIEKFTNGMDVEVAPGPAIAIGDTVEWTYVVTNTGNVTLTDVSVSDDQGVVVTCPMDTLAAGESMTCTGSGVATAGQYANVGSVSGQGVDDDGNPVGAPQSDSDTSYYFGAASGVTIEKFTNGVDVTVAPGPSIAVGDAVEWTYVVTNSGNVTLTNVTVTDDQGVTVTCPMTTLEAGESMTCSGNGTAIEGQYTNLGTVTGQGVDADGNPVGGPQTDNDPSYYFGVSSAIGIEKFTNGMDVTAAPGPFLPVASAIEWTYVVTNLGNVTLTNVVVTDDQGVTVSCPMDTLAAGESMTCVGSGFATPGQYTNIGTVTGQGVDSDGNPVGAPQTDSDASFYFGGVSKLSLEKYTNGEDADDPTGPEITVGGAVEWTYVVLNDGNVTISNVNVTDDQGVVVSCPMDTLAPGESMTCVGSGIATLGQYANVGTVTATGVDDGGDPFGLDLTASDPSHYLGVALPTSSIGDFVFLDTNRDGDQDFNEPGIPGVVVNLWIDEDGDGLPDTQIATTTTGPNGEYLFTDLDPNLVYVVQFVTEPGQQITDPMQGGDPATDSNPDASTGITGPITLSPGESNVTIDAGIFLLTSSVSLEKTTNGVDADVAPGPEISVGSAVLWEYTITNTGETSLINVNVSDDQGVLVTCPATELAPGESFVCTGEGIAMSGQYKNIGNVTAQPTDDGQPVGGIISGVDPSHYIGVDVCMPGFVLDQFSHVSYDNNDGDMNWAGPWQEHDPQGGGAGSGNVMVANGTLILNDYPNSHTEPSALREVNLDGYVSAMLMFDWSTSQEVGPEDTAVVEISNDGGLSYTVLRTFTDMHGANSGSESFNISAFISSQTVIRFRIAEKFGAMWDKFMVDNVRIDKKCENTQICVATSSAGHSFWMAGFNNPSDTDRFDFESGAQFEQFDDGTATLTGTIVDNARPNRRFEVQMEFSGRTLDPPVGSPKNGFNADPTGWEYYPEWTGSWSGLDDYEGVEISLARRGPAFQVGVGANDRPDEQEIYGGSAWYDWSVDSQADACSHTPGLCIEHDGIGDLNIRLDCTEGGPLACTSSVNETHKHAFYLPNFNGDGVLDRYDLEDGAEFVRNVDGTARLTGVIFKQGTPNYRFAIDVMLSGGTDTPPPGSPYNPHNANPDDWFYYPNWSGELDGLTWNAGAQLSIERRGASFQIGTGANAHAGENDIYGGSGWFDWTTQAQPYDCSDYGDCIKHEGHGDINVQIDQCLL